MASSPIYRVSLVKSGQELTDHVVGIHYEDCIDEDDLVTIKLDRLTNEWIDAKEINKGAEISYLFGFQSEAISGKRVAIIKDFEVTYDATISGTITALDTGFLFKKVTSNRIYKDLSISKIIQSIAELFGMPFDIDDTVVSHPSEPMGNMTYWKFMQKLATRAESSDNSKGHYQLYVKDGKLCFKQKNLSKPAKRTFTWNDGNGPVISFKPKYEQKDKESSGVTVSGVDPATNKVYKETSDQSKEEALGENSAVWKYNPDGAGTNSSTYSFPELDPGKFNIGAMQMKTPKGPTASDAKAHVKDVQSKAVSSELTATLSLNGTFGIESGEIISIAGVARKFSGNWYVTKVIHDIAGGGFNTDLELNKNGSKKSASETNDKNEKVNKTKGKDNAETIKEVPAYGYDADGKLIFTGNLKMPEKNKSSFGNSGAGGEW